MQPLTTAGKTYVVFGRAGLGSSGSLELSSLNGTNGFVLNGEKAGDEAASVASAGDINGDGIADLVVGAGRCKPWMSARVTWCLAEQG